jgi:transcription antitermination factor NusG
VAKLSTFVSLPESGELLLIVTGRSYTFELPTYSLSRRIAMPFQSNFRLPWFAVYVKYRHEKRVASILANKGYESFLPTYSKRHSNSMTFELPLFPGYVFSRLDTTNPLSVISTPGVFSILGNARGPEAIPEDQIETIRQIINASICPRPWPYLATGEPVYIAEGPLRGIGGLVVAASNERWLVVSVNLLQRSIAVKLDRASISSRAIYAVSVTT